MVDTSCIQFFKFLDGNSNPLTLKSYSRWIVCFFHTFENNLWKKAHKIFEGEFFFIILFHWHIKDIQCNKQYQLCCWEYGKEVDLYVCIEIPMQGEKSNKVRLVISLLAIYKEETTFLRKFLFCYCTLQCIPLCPYSFSRCLECILMQVFYL